MDIRGTRSRELAWVLALVGLAQGCDGDDAIDDGPQGASWRAGSDTGVGSSGSTTDTDTDATTSGGGGVCNNGVVEPPELCLDTWSSLNGGPGYSPRSYVFDDFTDDGIPDLVVMTERTMNLSPAAQIDVFAGDPVAGPTLVNTIYLYGPGQQGGVQLGGPYGGDFNGDGRTDLAFIERRALMFGGNQRHLRVWLSQGDATFVETFDNRFPVDAMVNATVGDFTGDASADVVTLDSRGLFLWTGTGTGLLTAPVRFMGPSDVTALTTVRYDGDGLDDLLLTAPAGPRMLLGQHGGAFLEVPLMACAGTLTVATDWDGDGVDDLLCRTGDTFDVYLGTGPMTFDPVPVTTVEATATASSRGGDFDGDGVMDIAWVSSNVYGTSVNVIRGLGDGSFGPAQLLSSDPGGGFGHWFSGWKIADLDQDGVDDVLISHFQVNNQYVLRMLLSEP